MQYTVTRTLEDKTLHLWVDGMTPKWVTKQKAARYGDKPSAEEAKDYFKQVDAFKGKATYGVQIF